MELCTLLHALTVKAKLFSFTRSLPVGLQRRVGLFATSPFPVFRIGHMSARAFFVKNTRVIEDTATSSTINMMTRFAYACISCGSAVACVNTSFEGNHNCAGFDSPFFNCRNTSLRLARTHVTWSCRFCFIPLFYGVPTHSSVSDTLWASLPNRHGRTTVFCYLHMCW